MNCTICKHGQTFNCKVWKEEEQFFNNHSRTPELPPTIFHLRMFRVIEDGSQCSHAETDDSAAIKRCPFCKGNEIEALPYSSTSYPNVKWKVICHTCRAEGPVKDNEEEAIAAWNA